VNPVVRPLAQTLELNTRLLLNALDGVDENTARIRASERTNHILFLACHLVDARHYLARSIGLESESPFKAMLDEAEGIDDVKEYPSLEEVRDAWTSGLSTSRSRRRTPSPSKEGEASSGVSRFSYSTTPTTSARWRSFADTSASRPCPINKDGTIPSLAR
jgi:hypothetical protein